VIVLDTTVLIYAVGGEHPLREPSARLVDAIGAGVVRATTTAEVVQEFVHIRARRHGRDDAVIVGQRWLKLLSPLLAVQAEHVESGLSLYRRHRLGAFDAVLAAVALDDGAEALVSADLSFAEIPGLTHVAPGTPAFDQLVAH
jgi:predicted nucleic acid-binding protein